MELITTREPISCLATRQFPSIPWNAKVHFRIHKSSPVVPILSHNTPFYSTRSNLILDLRFSRLRLWKRRSSGILRHAPFVGINVSEESRASIIRATRMGELGTLAVTKNRRRWFLSPWSWRCYVPPKCRFLPKPHWVKSQKTALYNWMLSTHLNLGLPSSKLTLMPFRNLFPVFISVAAVSAMTPWRGAIRGVSDSILCWSSHA
jgi:hypothetical protein